MKQKEFENLSKDELFEKIKAENVQKAKYDLIIGIVCGLLLLAIIIFDLYFFFTKGDSLSFVILSGIFLVMSLEKILFSVIAKKLIKAENAEELLSRYDAYTNRLRKFLPFIVVLALFLIGYVIYHMITETNIERFGVVLFWLTMAVLVLCFIFLLMMIIPMKGNVKDVGWKDNSIERLRELVEQEKQDTF